VEKSKALSRAKRLWARSAGIEPIVAENQHPFIANTL